MQAERFIPLPDESIKSWVERYTTAFRKAPNSSNMQRSAWPCLSLAANAQMNASRALQSALTALKEFDPTGESYYWPGQAKIWFTSESDIVMLKLRMSP